MQSHINIVIPCDYISGQNLKCWLNKEQHDINKYVRKETGHLKLTNQDKEKNKKICKIKGSAQPVIHIPKAARPLRMFVMCSFMSPIPSC